MRCKFVKCEGLGGLPLGCSCKQSPLYCSRLCKEGDWHHEHKYECGRHLKFTLSELRESLGLLDYSKTSWTVHLHSKTYLITKVCRREVKEVETRLRFLQRVANRVELQLSTCAEVEQVLEDSEWIYLGLAWNKGPTLDQLIVSAPLDYVRTHDLFRNICELVQQLQQNNAWHGLLEPKNLVVLGDSVLLQDSSCEYKSTMKASKDYDRQQYLAPETLKGEPVTAWTDSWALGVLLYELTYGRTPFASSQQKYIHKRVLAADFRLNDQVPPQTNDLIKRLLRVNPVERLSMSEIFDHTYFRLNKVQVPTGVPIHLNLPTYGMVQGSVSQLHDSVYQVLIQDIGRTVAMTAEALKNAYIQADLVQPKKEKKMPRVQTLEIAETSRQRVSEMLFKADYVTLAKPWPLEIERSISLPDTTDVFDSDASPSVCQSKAWRPKPFNMRPLFQTMCTQLHPRTFSRSMKSLARN